MNISLLNQRAIFQKCEVTEDEIGNHQNTWTDFYSCMGTISNETGSQEEEIGKSVYHPEMDVTIRYCKKAFEIEPLSYRVIFNGSSYDITSVNHLNYKKRCMKFHLRKEA